MNWRDEALRILGAQEEAKQQREQAERFYQYAQQSQRQSQAYPPWRGSESERFERAIEVKAEVVETRITRRLR
jgi:hypothetical protein